MTTNNLFLLKYRKMVKSTHLFRSLAYVEPFKLMPSIPTRLTSQAMIDNCSSKETTTSMVSSPMNSPPIPRRSNSRESHKSASPNQSSRLSSTSSPLPVTTRSNLSPVSGTGGRMTSPGLLRPLEIQSPNNINLQLPPSCGAKQLAKLKRFLTTLQQFGSDISQEIGDRVRSLVLALVNSQMSIEDFHAKLQETTNFPLKPFVIPFLKATLPSLQRELLQCAQLSRQSPQQYLASNERVVFDLITSSAEQKNSSSISPEFRDDSQSALKRKLSCASNNSSDVPPTKKLLIDSSSPNSVRCSRSPLQATSTSLSNDDLIRQATTDGKLLLGKDLLPSPALIKLEDITRLSRARLESSDFSALQAGISLKETNNNNNNATTTTTDAEDDNWKRVELMLASMSNLVEKTKSAMSNLQESRVRETQEFSMWMRRHAEGVDQDFKKRTGEMMTQTIRQSEDKIADIKRRADDMVIEFKRQAIIEIHQAVATAEIKANELVSQERIRMENVLAHIKKTAKDEALRTLNKQAESPENCWNCGRRASETCSGCNKARYCGQFCQHKDWDRHHVSCGSLKDKATDKKKTTPNVEAQVETKQEKLT